MFEENPFAGACAYALWEVIVMLAGTLALGVLLGYLIWGWTKRKLLLAENRVKELGIEVGQLDEQLTRLQAIEQKQRLRAASWAVSAVTGGPGAVDARTAESPMQIQEQPEVFPLSEPGEENFRTISDPEHIIHPVQENPFSEDELRIASQVLGKDVRYNDLEIIEGIGPMISEVLMRSGITSWEKLAGTTKHILRVILDEAGPQYRIHKPKTWPKQAQMALDGEWKKLKAYQDTLMGGK